MFKVEEVNFLKSIRIFVWGCRPGLGKTMLVTYLMQLAMFQCRQNLNYLKSQVDDLNNLGFRFSTNFEHLGFANFDINCLGTSYPYLRSYRVNPYEIGFFLKDMTKPFPPNSVFGITEFQNYYPSSMNDYIRPEYLMKYQTSRHTNLSFIVDCQRPTDVAKKIRDLFNIFIECCGVEEVIKDDYLVGIKWKVKIIYNPFDLERYLRSGDNTLCEETEIYCPWVLYRNYDSYFCKMLHYKGFEKEDFEFKYFGDGDDSDIYLQPKDFFVSKPNRVQKTEDIVINEGLY